MILEIALLVAHAAVQPKMETPKPKPAAHKFYDRPAQVQLAAAVALNTWDTVQTCQHVGQQTWIQQPATTVNNVYYWYPPKLVIDRETALPTQSCAGVTALLAAQLVGQELAAYVLHRTGHHKIERVVRLYSMEQNTQGIISSHLARQAIESERLKGGPQ